MKKNNKKVSKKMKKALECYFKRQSREEHPDGWFENSKRWYPYSDTEARECCKGIRNPSSSRPFSLIVHCRTALHISHLYDVDVKELHSHIAQWHLLKKEVEASV